MNTLVTTIYTFKKKVQHLPLGSDERIFLEEQLFSTVEFYLSEAALGLTKEFLLSRYLCPVSCLPQPETNLRKITDSITRAINEPTILKTVRLATVPDQPLPVMLGGLCKKGFGTYVQVHFRIIQGQSAFDFVGS
jgi:hypothetical protein